MNINDLPYLAFSSGLGIVWVLLVFSGLFYLWNNKDIWKD